MQGEEFFREREEQSRIKSQIVAKYFWSWAKVILPRIAKDTGRIVYLDLFCGPGVYQDGSPSTPLLVLRRAIAEPEMCRRLISIFHDSDADSIRRLQSAVASLPDVDRLAHKPIIRPAVTDDELSGAFEQVRLHPTLLFADPWGYKGVSKALISAVVKDWGCECIVFFNYLRINMALQNPLLWEPMDALFGPKSVGMLKLRLPALGPDDREMLILETFTQALSDTHKLYVLPFRFRDERGSRTSHHLVFISKNVLGYTIMKDIMARESSSADQGVPSFEYNKATRDFPRLFELTRPLDDLAAMLLQQFAGQTLSVEDVFRLHHVGRPFIRRNYQEVLEVLESEGKIGVKCTNGKRRRNTFPMHLIVTFPEARS